MKLEMSANTTYQEQYQQFLDNPEAFWREQAARITWYKQPETILSVDENESEFTITYNQINNSVVVANWAGDSEVVSLYDLSGKQLMIFNLNQPYQEFKLSNSLAPGVYLFGNENQSIKILVNQ